MRRPTASMRLVLPVGAAFVVGFAACASSPSAPSASASSAAPSSAPASPPLKTVDLDASTDAGPLEVETSYEDRLRAMACDTPACWQRERDEHARDTIALFDRGAAARAIDGADLSSCAPHDAEAKGHVRIVFAPNGVARDVTIAAVPPGADAAVPCLKSAFARVRVPAFDGGPLAVTKSFTLR